VYWYNDSAAAVTYRWTTQHDATPAVRQPRASASLSPSPVQQAPSLTAASDLACVISAGDVRDSARCQGGVITDITSQLSSRLQTPSSQQQQQQSEDNM